MTVVICDDEAKLKHLVNEGKDKLPGVKTVVHMEAISSATEAACQEQGWQLVSFETMEVCKHNRLFIYKNYVFIMLCSCVHASFPDSVVVGNFGLE